MATGTTLFTADEFMDVCEEYDGLCELVRGEVREVTRPSFQHGCICANICGELWGWAKPRRLGHVIANDAGVLTERNPDTVRGPDLYFISSERLPNLLPERRWLAVPPDLCVEVLSPSDRWKDVLDKVAEYLEFGVLEVWVADPESNRLHVYTPDWEPQILEVNDKLSSPRLPEFNVPVSRFFEGC